ncbi:hypothetical protein D9M73_172380 [compost metagenome]
MEPAVLKYQLALFQGAAQAAQQVLRREGFFQEVIGPHAHGFYRHRYISVTGQQNHGQVGVVRLQAFEQLQAIHARHAHIADDHPREVLRQVCQARFGASEQLHAEARQAQPLLDSSADTGFIIDDDHRIQHTGSRSRGRVRLRRAPPGRFSARSWPPASWTMP